ARHTVPSPLVGEGQGEGWRQSTEWETSRVRRFKSDGSLHLSSPRYETNAVHSAPLSLSLPRKGGGNPVPPPCPMLGQPSRRFWQNAGTSALFATSIAIGALLTALSAKARPFEDPRAALIPALDTNAAIEPRDPACHASVLASTGGAMPKYAHTLAVR